MLKQIFSAEPHLLLSFLNELKCDLSFVEKSVLKLSCDVYMCVLHVAHNYPGRASQLRKKKKKKPHLKTIKKEKLNRN